MKVNPTSKTAFGVLIVLALAVGVYFILRSTGPIPTKPSGPKSNGDGPKPLNPDLPQKMGDRSPEVAEIQRVFNRTLALIRERRPDIDHPANLNPDGIWGSKTQGVLEHLEPGATSITIRRAEGLYTEYSISL